VSTTFDVYPRTSQLPTFAAILDRSTAELHRFLGSVGIHARPPIHVRLQRYEDHGHLPFDLSDEARWGKNIYAWFMVGEVPGGTDAYYDDSPEHIREFWNGELQNTKYRENEPAIRQAIEIGHAWSFRRSMGQWAVINIAYGLIAASLASLTDGFVHSVDSAWDWDRLPALPQDFLIWYFRPERAIEENFRTWSARCIDHLAEELGG
jgi:hypothetical protein